MQPFSAGSGPGSGSSRWSMASSLRQSIIGSQFSQRPSPMGPLTGDDYGMLTGSLMGPPNNRRMSSFAPRQSFSSTGGGGGGVGMPGSLSAAGISGISTSSINIRDPRPVKDKSFQRTLIHTILGYLTQSGFPQTITTKNLTHPTNKDFQDIFKFLYLRLEPGYEFQKKFEDEVPMLLKTMRYPAADTISKTSLYTVGTPHSWPNMLALLGWMIEVIMVLERFKELTEALLQQQQQQQYSLSYSRARDLDPKMDMSLVTAEKALYHYLTRTYRIWMLTGNLQDPDLESKLELSLQRRMEYAQEELRSRTAAIDALKQELQAFETEESPLVILEKEQQTLKDDIEQFQKAIEHAEPRIESLRRANEETKKTIENKQRKLEELEHAKVEVQEVVRSQTISRGELQTKIEERDRLKRREEGLKQQLNDLENEQRSLDNRFQQGEIEAERLAKEYNALAVKIGIVPISAKYAGGQDYELRLSLDNATSNTGKLFSVDIKGKVDRVVSALRTKIAKDRNEVSNERFTLEEELEKLKDQVEEGSRLLAEREYQLGVLRQKYQEEKELARTEINNHQAHVKSRQERIEAMLQEMRENDTEADRLEQETIMIERHAAHNREIFYRQTKEVLTQLVDIKQHVEQQVGLIRVMAEKELQDTMAQKLQALEVIQKELENEQKRNSLQIGTNLTELDEQLLESTFDRPLLFSTL